MSIQEIIAPARGDREISAGQSIALAVILGLMLAFAAQGSLPAASVEDWHGNAAASNWR